MKPLVQGAGTRWSPPEAWLLMIFSGTQLGADTNVALAPLGSLKLTGLKAGVALVTGSRPVRGSKLMARIWLVLVTAAQATELESFASTGEAQPKLFHFPSPAGGAPRLMVDVVLPILSKANPSIVLDGTGAKAVAEARTLDADDGAFVFVRRSAARIWLLTSRGFSCPRVRSRL